MKNGLMKELAIKLKNRYKGHPAAYAVRNPHKAKRSYYAIRSAVTLEVMEKHITGSRPIGIYPSIPGTSDVFFGVLDLDKKQKRLDQAFYLEDALSIARSLSEMSIPCGLARSSGDGLHITLFFAEPVPAITVREIFREAIFRSGVLESNETFRRFPEIFPKNSSSSDLGFPICLPMNFNCMQKGRNCWLDNESGLPIALDLQWEYFTEIPNVDLKEIATQFSFSSPQIAGNDSAHQTLKPTPLPPYRLFDLLDPERGCVYSGEAAS